MVFGSDLGMAYLGTQGDVWDSHKDMACAAFGAMGSMLLLATVNRLRSPAPEWFGSAVE
jgi:putative membrane protein